MLGELLGCKLGIPLRVGNTLGWMDGAVETDGFAVGTKDGWEDTLGESDTINDGTPVLVGPRLGRPDG